MAYDKRPGNLFHNIKGSQSSQAPTQPGIGGMGEVESPAPYIVPVVRGALALAARTGVGQAIKQGGKQLFKKGVKKAVEYVPKTSFGKKAFNVAMNVATGVGIGSMFGSDDSSSQDTKGASDNTSTNGGSKKKPGSYVKPGGKATGNMKDYALNSQGRRDEYTARGWKQDDTTSVKGGNKVVSELKSNPVVKVDSTPVAEPLTVTPPASTTKPTAVQTQKAKNTMDRKNRSIDKKQGKIDDANALGNTKKATRKQRSLDNKKARLADKGKLDQKYMSDLSGAEKPKEESPVPYTSRIQASAKWRKPNAAGQYDK